MIKSEIPFIPTPEQDKRLAAIARRLAETLKHFARERDMESKQRIAVLQSELCRTLDKDYYEFYQPNVETIITTTTIEAKE